MSLHWSMAEFAYTPAQEKIFRAVAGAVVNAAHGHPNWKLSKTIARSIAKRAAGTLTASWPEVLAARALSDKVEELGLDDSRPSRTRSGRSARKGGASPLRGMRVPNRRSPFKLVHNALGAMAAEAKRDGQVERANALIDALRLVAQLRKQEEGL